MFSCITSALKFTRPNTHHLAQPSNKSIGPTLKKITLELETATSVVFIVFSMAVGERCARGGKRQRTHEHLEHGGGRCCRWLDLLPVSHEPSASLHRRRWPRTIDARSPSLLPRSLRTGVGGQRTSGSHETSVGGLFFFFFFSFFHAKWGKSPMKTATNLLHNQ
jgi:hypothetical protein